MFVGHFQFKGSFTKDFLVQGLEFGIALDLKEPQVIHDSGKIPWELRIFSSPPRSFPEFLTLNNVPV